MGLNIADLQRDQRILVIDINVGTDEVGAQLVEPLTVTYRPSAYTGRTERELNEILKGDWKSLFGLEFLRKLIIEWDLLDDDGTPFPLAIGDENTRGLQDLPAPFIGDVIKAVADDLGKDRPR